MDNFEGITPAECRPLARRLLTLAVHAERIQWPKGIVKDLRDAALVLEITAERAEDVGRIAPQRRVVADPDDGLPTRLNDPAAHVDPFSTPQERWIEVTRHRPNVEAVLSDEVWGKDGDPMSRENWTKENDATKDYS